MEHVSPDCALNNNKSWQWERRDPMKITAEVRKITSVRSGVVKTSCKLNERKGAGRCGIRNHAAETMAT